jgi:hypothetical protein
MGYGGMGFLTTSEQWLKCMATAAHCERVVTVSGSVRSPRHPVLLADSFSSAGAGAGAVCADGVEVEAAGRRAAGGGGLWFCHTAAVVMNALACGSDGGARVE